jgi:hypothetical protein
MISIVHWNFGDNMHNSLSKKICVPDVDKLG